MPTLLMHHDSLFLLTENGTRHMITVKATTNHIGVLFTHFISKRTKWGLTLSLAQVRTNIFFTIILESIQPMHFDAERKYNHVFSDKMPKVIEVEDILFYLFARGIS